MWWWVSGLVVVAAAVVALVVLAPGPGTPRGRGRSGVRWRGLPGRLWRRWWQGPGGRGGAPSRVPGRTPSGRGPAGRTTRVGTVPAPGQIWWAEVPFEEGSGAKLRPCLVVRVRGRQADVLKITSADRSGRPDHLRLPPFRDGRPHWLQLAPTRQVPLDRFEEFQGLCPERIWNRVAG